MCKFTATYTEADRSDCAAPLPPGGSAALEIEPVSGGRTPELRCHRRGGGTPAAGRNSGSDRMASSIETSTDASMMLLNL